MLIRYRNLIAAVLTLFLGICFFISGQSIPVNSQTVVTPGIMPCIAGILMAVLGIILLFQAIRDYQKKKHETDQSETDGHPVSLIFSVVLLFLYIFLWQSVGFVIMTILYLFCQISVFCPKDKRSAKAYFLFAVISVIAAILIWLVFSKGFHLTLPDGILG